MKIGSSHVPGGCCVPKPVSGFINCQWIWLVLWGSASLRCLELGLQCSQGSHSIGHMQEVPLLLVTPVRMQSADF